jgi:hypothetical protein
MDGTVAMVAIGVSTAVFVFFAYYWWEVRPAKRDKEEDS